MKTKAEKRRFVRELVGSVRRDLLKQIERVPESWDGIELRQYIADTFQAHAYLLQRDKRRYRDYQNEKLVRNI